jgi:fucose 4-O-acetylase-like acetyltransferase
MTGGSATGAQASRVGWIDLARGVSIILIVEYHVWKGLEESPVVHAPPSWFEHADRSLGMARMGLFFFVSGMFIAKAVERPAAQFISDKARTVVWPYVVWTIAFVLVNAGLSKVAGTDPDDTLGELPVGLLARPVGVYWFFYVLFLSFMLFLALWKAGAPRIVIFWVAVALMFVQVNVTFDFVAFDVAGRHFSLGSWGPMFLTMSYFAYFALGALLSKLVLGSLHRQHPVALGVAAAIATAVVVVIVFNGGTRTDVVDIGSVHLPVGQLYAVVGLVAALAGAAFIDRYVPSGWARRLGQFSLYIFVLHVLFTSATRIALEHAGVDQFPVQLVIGTVVGVICPLGVAVLVQRYGGEMFFVLPRGRIATATTASPASSTVS